MKRVDLIHHLERHGVQFLREGGSHTVCVNRAAGKTSTGPRQREINDFLAQKICKDLAGCGKTLWTGQDVTGLHVWHKRRSPRRMLKKAIQQGRSKRRGEAYASVR
jgi:mRNA interferase HicA